MTERYCTRCRIWHEKHTGCPECGSEPAFNKGLWTGVLNSGLFNQANEAEKDRRKAEYVMRGGSLPAEPWAQKRAKELVEML